MGSGAKQFVPPLGSANTSHSSCGSDGEGGSSIVTRFTGTNAEAIKKIDHVTHGLPWKRSSSQRRQYFKIMMAVMGNENKHTLKFHVNRSPPCISYSQRLLTCLRTPPPPCHPTHPHPPSPFSPSATPELSINSLISKQVSNLFRHLWHA